MHLLYMYLQVMPVFHVESVGRHWIDLVTPLAVGSTWLSCFLWCLGKRSLLPRYDLNYGSAIELHRTELEKQRDEAPPR